MENKCVVISEKIAIGISACCMGAPVRYNSKGWDLLKNLGREKADFIWCPVCPECMAGLGVPRDPIHIKGESGAKVWNGEAEVVNRKGNKITSQLKEGAIACADALKRAGAIAYIYMEGSPSCGVYRTTLKNQKRGNPPGVFGSYLLDNGFFLIPSSDLQSPLKWWDWRRRLLAFSWIGNFAINSKSELYSAWHKLKFLCQELDDSWSREMGKKLANMTGEFDQQEAENFKHQIMSLLRKPSTTRKITNSLWKGYSYYRKTKGKPIDGINSPEFRRNVTSIAKEMILMERKSIEDEILFGSSPLIFREKRPSKQESKN